MGRSGTERCDFILSRRWRSLGIIASFILFVLVLPGRGSEGETVLHLCTLLGTDAHANVVRYLLTKFGGEMAMEEGQQ